MQRYSIVLCTREGSVGALLLRRYMNCPFSHSAIIDHRTGIVYDSTLSHGGVRRWDVDDFFSMYPVHEIRPLDVPAENELAADLWLQAQVGKPYDWTALAGIFFRRDWSEDDSWFCSELSETFRYLFAATRKFRITGKRWAAVITPQHQYIAA